MNFSQLILSGADRKTLQTSVFFAATAMAVMSPQAANAQDLDDVRPVAEHFEPGERTRIATERVTRGEGDDASTKKEKIYVTYHGLELAENCAPMEHFTLEAERKTRTEQDRRRRWRVVESQERYIHASLTEPVRAQVEQCLLERTELREAELQAEFRTQAARQALGIALDVDEVQGVQRDQSGSVTLNVSMDFTPQ